MGEDVNSCIGTPMGKKQIVNNTKKPVTHPKTRVMVMEAVAELNGKGGVSLKAIKKCITKVHEVDVEKMAHSIRKAITKALANGELVQVKGSGPNGTFKLPLATKNVVKPNHFKPRLTIVKSEREEFQYECGLCDSPFSFSKKKKLRDHLKFIHGEKANKNEEDVPNPARSMIIAALEFLTYPRQDYGVSHKRINRCVHETFNVKTDCLNELLNEMVREGILLRSDDRTYSKNTLHLYWFNQNIKVGLEDLGKVRKGNSGTNRKRRRSVTDKGGGTVPKRLRMDGSVTRNEDSPRRHLSNEEIRFARSVVGREGTPAFNQFLGFLITEEGKRCLEVLKGEGVNLTNMSSILSGAGAKAPKAFKDLCDLWFDETGKKTQYLKTLENEGLKLSNMSSILGKARANATIAFKELYDLWFDEQGKKTQYIKSLEEGEISLSNLSSILSGSGSNAAIAFKDLYEIWFDEQGKKTHYLRTLEKEGLKLSNISSILGKARANAAKAFIDLYDLWFNRKGKKTQYLKTLEKEGMILSNLSSILGGSGANAAKAFKELYDLWFHEEGQKTHYLLSLEKEEINLSNMTSILCGTGSNAAIAFKELYDIWFDGQGKKTKYLDTLQDNGVSLARMSSILGGAGSNASKAFKELYDLWFNKKGKKTRYLKTLEEEGINLSNMSSILSGAGAKAARTFTDLYDLWFDEQGSKKRYLKTLEGHGINLSNMSSILSGAGSSAAKAFEDLSHLWFDAEGKKKQYLKTLEKEGINLCSISSILHGSGSSAVKAFKGLCDLWFDAEGSKTHCLKTLENEGINLSNISSILHGSRSNAVKAFKDLCNLWFDEEGNKRRHLKHFIKKKDGEKSFSMHNLSGILSGSGANIKDSFEKLHRLFFSDKGKRTKLLDDFYKEGFKPRNLSCKLNGAGPRASPILKRFHSLCFDHEGGERTKLLDDFCNAGFKPGDLCNMLSGTADSLQEFYDFCFIGETKKYLNHFLNENEIDSSSVSNLSEILHGAKANICSAFKDLHDVCFDEAGSATQLLKDFYRTGFTMSDLSSILTMAGNNAASILRNVHKCCFNEDNFLSHFLAEKELFTPENLSKILYRVGLSICSAFEKLHGLCFDGAGNKTDYLNNLIQKNSTNTVIHILYKKVEKVK